MKQRKQFLECFPEKEVIEAVKAILKSGGDVEIRRRGDGIAVFEVTKKIKYCT